MNTAAKLFCVPTGNPELSLTFKVTRRGVALLEPRLSRVAAIRGRTLAPSVLLFELMQKGLYLMPQGRDGESVGLVLKVSSVIRWGLC